VPELRGDAAILVAMLAEKRTHALAHASQQSNRVNTATVCGRA